MQVNIVYIQRWYKHIQKFQKRSPHPQEVLGIDSRWIVYSFQSGSQADKLSFSTLMKKRITLSGTVSRARPIDYKTNLVKQFEDEAIHGFLDGKLKVIIDKTWPMEQIIDAHKYMEDNLNMGKLVVTAIEDK
jgi:NADPH:quinone reductase-like Zn-dependent oxidoreductase